MTISLRIVGVCLLAWAGFILAGCGGDDTSAANDGSESAAQGLRLAVIPKGNSHEFWQSVRAGAEAAAGEWDEVELFFRGPANENDLTQQRELFEQQLSRGVDAIAIAPVDGEALAPVIDSAARAQVPVVVFDSGTSAEHYASYVATDNYAAGRQAGEAMVRLLAGSGKVMMMPYQVGSSSTEERERGFMEVIAEHDDIQVLSADQEGAGREKEVAETLLQNYGEAVNGIYTPNESTTTGMMLALRDGGYYQQGIQHVGFDATSAIIESIENDEIQAVVIQNPVGMGEKTVRALYALAREQSVETVIDTGSALVTAESLHEPQVRQLLGLD